MVFKLKKVVEVISDPTEYLDNKKNYRTVQRKNLLPKSKSFDNGPYGTAVRSPFVMPPKTGSEWDDFDDDIPF